MPLILDSLTKPLYEPLAKTYLEAFSLNAAFLLAICSEKRVELCVLSVSDDCLHWKPEGTGVSLWPNPAFLPKVINPQFKKQILEMAQFQPPSQTKQEGLLSLCPVRALCIYVNVTQPLRNSHSQLFVCHGKTRLGLQLSKQRLSHWLVDVISHDYTVRGLPVPVGVRDNSTRGVATSWAALKGVQVEDICAAASWSMPCMFTKFYRCDVTSATPVSSEVTRLR